MEKFINGIIDGQKFEEEFYQIWRLNRDKEYSSEEILKINNEKLIESKGFSTIISNLFTDCDVFEPDPSLREDYEISEVELKNRVKKNFIRNKISLSLLNIIKYLESKIIFVFHLIRRLFFFNLL